VKTGRRERSKVKRARSSGIHRRERVRHDQNHHRREAAKKQTEEQ
jgi:hypothetical protein